MFLRKRRAQGILEYTLLLGAMIAVIVTALMRSNTGIGARVESAYEDMGNAISDTAENLTKSAFTGD